MKTRPSGILLYSLLVLVLAGPAPLRAGTSAAGDLENLTRRFMAEMSSAYQVKRYPWAFVTAASCFGTGSNCNGANPDSPYGQVVFSENSRSTQLKKTSAIVLLMQTPPPMSYFGLTTYINTRYYADKPGNPGTPGTVEVSESLNDSVNQLDIATAGAPVPGQAPFDQLAAFVITADATTSREIDRGLQLLGYPASGINHISLPYAGVPLQMGTAQHSDTYSVLMRLAYANRAAALTKYLDAAPINTLVLQPLQARAIDPLPPPTYKVPGDAEPEADILQQARDELAAQLVQQYSSSYRVVEQDVASTLTQTSNYQCVVEGRTCNVDNPDALYLQEVTKYIPSTPSDMVLVVGVDHVKSGKATYTSDSVVDYVHNTGVVAINNVELNGSALKMAGITSPDDPRFELYRHLYAFVIGYDCAAQPVCLQIPRPTADDPIGIPFGAPFRVTSRIYLDPATMTRPPSSQMIFQRAFTLWAP